MDADEEMLLMRTLRDMNLSKLVAQDTPLFLSLLTDLFPNVRDPPGRQFPKLAAAIDGLLTQLQLVKHPQWVNKVMQLYETTLVRHGIMLVGPAGSGKSTIFKVLMEALAEVQSTHYKMIHMNPKVRGTVAASCPSCVCLSVLPCGPAPACVVDVAVYVCVCVCVWMRLCMVSSSMRLSLRRLCLWLLATLATFPCLRLLAMLVCMSFCFECCLQPGCHMCSSRVRCPITQRPRCCPHLTLRNITRCPTTPPPSYPHTHTHTHARAHTHTHQAIRAEEMFGETEALSGEWLPGVFGAMWEKFNRRDAAGNVWLVCDGPVDAIWIENLNTVLDDNKILTLANGDRMPMTDNVKLMFEVQDLRNASPATVSRAGIIFVSETDLDWEPVVEAWLRKQGEAQAAVLRACFAKYVKGEKPVGALSPERHGILFFFLNRKCRPVMARSRIGIVTGCLQLLGSMLSVTGLGALPAAEVEDEEVAGVRRCFLFALAWAAGGLLEDDERVVFDGWLRAMEAPLPSVDEAGDTVFNYVVDQYSQQWKPWEPEDWEFPEAGRLPPDTTGPGGVVGAFDTASLLVRWWWWWCGACVRCVVCAMCGVRCVSGLFA